jgi:hypothetical protein
MLQKKWKKIKANDFVLQFDVKMRVNQQMENRAILQALARLMGWDRKFLTNKEKLLSWFIIKTNF